MNDTRPKGSRADTVVIVGQARLPQSLSPVGGPAILVELEVEREDGVIAEVHLGGFLPGAGRLLADLLVGKHMQRDFGLALDEFQHRYVGPPQKAISTALSNAHESYERYLRQSRLEPFFSSRTSPRGERQSDLELP